VKRPTMLVEAVLRQAALDLDLSVERDVETIRRRCDHEGFSFLTITLPMLSDALEKGLEHGLLTVPTQFSRNGSLPRLLGGFFRRVFDKEGRLLPEPCSHTVFYVRQISRFMKKLKISCTPEREAQAAAHFLEVEGELHCGTQTVLRPDSLLDRISGVLWSQVFPEIDPLDLVCSHGPGATAERLKPNGRYRIRYWHDRMELTFPSDLHCFPNYGLAASGCTRNDIDWDRGPSFLSVRDEPPVRVVFVPKTQTSPRVIAIEPSHVQYAQQALKDHVYVILESHKLTRNSIRFTRQEPNQELAYRSSIDRRLATLDLKDASDRVHLGLVQRVFKTSGILEYLEDSRSLHAELPTGQSVLLSKFASMGSAMCFPVEAMVFYTLVQCAMHKQDGRRPSSGSIAAYSRSIDIYGDDIIVPVDYADAVVEYLESYLLKVNIGKSFKSGYFRESCGADYFKGMAVNPVYARTVPHDDLRHWSAEEVMSWNATADLFYLRGMWQVAQVIRDLLAKVVGVTIPRTRFPGSGVVHVSLLFTTNLAFNQATYSWKQKRLHFTPVKTKDDIDGNELACLNKWGLNRSRTAYSQGLDPAILSDRERVVSLLRELQNVGNDRSGSPTVRSRKRRSKLLRISYGLSVWECFTPTAEPVDVLGDQEDAGRTWHGIEVPHKVEHYGRLGASSFFDLLAEESQGLDFNSSTKRGGFKSKHRWVSVVS